MKQKSEMGFVKKLSNLWYYYKWAILAGIVIGAFILIATCQFAAKISPDAMIMYAGSEALSPDVFETLETVMSGILREDYNGDGHKKADILQITFHMYPPDGEEGNALYDALGQSETKQRFDIELSIGPSVIYILDPALYEGLKDSLLPLADALGYLPDGAIDRYGVPLGETELYRSTVFASMPSDAVLCIRARRKSNIVKANDDPDYYNNNVAFFRDLLEYKGT